MNVTNLSEPRSRRAAPLFVGLVALAVAMGIGRFAFTPLLPLMLRDSLLDPTLGSQWATANYLGYLVGALTAARWRHHLAQGLTTGLVGIAGLTLLTAWPALTSLPVTGLLLRFSCGVLSAWVLVCASSWCLEQLTAQGSAAKAGMIYSGVGAGIAVTGTITWLGGPLAASTLWLVLGAMAMLGALLVMGRLGPTNNTHTRSDQTVPTHDQPEPRHHWGLILCYSLAGFGYILPATYLPAMGQTLTDNALLFGLSWPLFGLAAMVSVVIVTRWLSAWSDRQRWALAQALLAAGTVVPVLWPSLSALAVSALLVGGTFMVITMAGLQLARSLAPANPTALLARMTAGFALGQIAGPVLVTLLTSVSPLSMPLSLTPIEQASVLAGGLLVISAGWLWWGNPTPGRVHCPSGPSSQRT
ncbi:YbfB/YjiJ family MFS transporter [Marinobacter xestospongiae]|uniref:YbfB/YjiJ family MFS transporter n=1 Tax=Marinobacter xestospongiae TaxID=994319 RepID=A0ABU3W373_9GAMM|nr:YbfB/YjiJ family MFS transporter [Marinobacter xestospongiae]MDV2080795.1 YbfB/YjiJ family MFS transporter [Marinobacter xestospongiae]